MPSFIENVKKSFSPLEFVCPGGYREIWSVAWPLIIMNATSTLMMMLNRAFLSHNQLEDVTAAVTAGQLFWCVNAFFLITTSFTGTIVAQHYGNEDRKSCVHAVWNGFYFSLIVGAVLLAILPIAGSFIFRFGHVSPMIIEKEVIYFNALTPCAVIACMEAPFLSYFTATGRSKLVAVIKIIVCLISVPFNYALIYGFWVIPPLGILGAGLAASFACAVSFTIAIICFLCQKQSEWESRRNRGFSWEIIRKLVVFGMPGGLRACVSSAAYAIVLFFFAFLGDFSLSAATLAMTINNIGFFPLMGLMDAASVTTGKYIGKRHLSVADKISSRAMKILSCYFVFIAVLYLAIPEQLIGLFAPSQEAGIRYADVLKMVKIILIFQIVQNFFDGLRFIVMGSLRGAGDTRIPLILSMLTSWLVQVPMAYLLSCVFPCPIWLAWGGSTTLYVIVDAIVIQWRKSTGAWRKIKVIDLPANSKIER